MLSKIEEDYRKVIDENRKLKQTKAIENQESSYNDPRLEKELGPKYKELGGMIEEAKSNLKRIADDYKRAKPLPIRIQHNYHYSKWDSINEPYNVVENVLRDDDSVQMSTKQSMLLSI